MMNQVKKKVEKYGPKLIGAGLNALALLNKRAAAQKALNIFCTPRQGRVKSHQREFLDKFQKETLQHKGMHIATYELVGSGPKILLCHGWESNSFRWRKLYKELRKADCHIIMMDAPAHGESGSETFTALLYAEMIEVVADKYQPGAICGHSVGGMATIFYLYRSKPEFVHRAIILASPDRLTDITTNYFKIIGGGSRLRSAYDRLMVERFGHPVSYFSAAAFASELDMRAMIIHDEYDTINTYDEGVRIYKAWQGSELVTTQQLGHSLQSEVVFRDVVEFVTDAKIN